MSLEQMKCFCNDLDNYHIMVPTCRPKIAAKTIKSLGSPDNLTVLDGTDYPGFSKLINDCIVQCPTEIVIVACDKTRPELKHVKKTIRMLKEGYGFVGLYCFGFFGFKKELIRRIGFMDERYLNGGYEDGDMIRRLREADISYTETKEVKFEQVGSAFHGRKNRNGEQIHKAKWEENKQHLKRLMPEETYSYDIGPLRGCEFHKWSESSLLKRSAYFKTIKMRI